MIALTGLPAPAVTQVLVQLALVSVVAHLGGRAARALRQPAVLGQVLAGMLLGPSIAARAAAEPWAWTFDREPEAASVLPALASLGAVLILALAGLGLDLGVVQERARKLPVLVVGALVPGLVGGLLIGLVLPERFIGTESGRWGFAALMAIALAISSPPVMSAVLRELGVGHRSFANVALSVAMVTDVVGWVLLGVVVAGASGAAGALGRAGIGLVVVAALVAGLWWLLPRWHPGPQSPSLPAIGVVVILALAAITNEFGIEAVLGAFLAGIALRRFGDHGAEVRDGLRPVVDNLLGPLFFAYAGLRVDLRSFGSASVIGWTVALIGVASIAKVVGSGGAWRLAGRPRSESLAMGAILNVRGSLEIVLAGVGLSAGILTDTSYAAVIVMAVVTSAMAAPLIRYAFGAEGLAARQQPVEPATPRR